MFYFSSQDSTLLERLEKEWLAPLLAPCARRQRGNYASLMERNANSRDYFSSLAPTILFVGDENEPVIEPFLPPRTNSAGESDCTWSKSAPQSTRGFNGIPVHWVKLSPLEQSSTRRAMSTSLLKSLLNSPSGAAVMSALCLGGGIPL